MHAVIVAGGMVKPGEPLCPSGEAKPKCLLNINGRPMLQWVLDAVGAATSVESIVIVGLGGSQMMNCAKPLKYLPDQGGMIRNLVAGARFISAADPATTHILGVSSDIPAVTGGMVDWAISTAMKPPADLCLNIVTRRVMEQAFPGSRRTYFNLSGAEFCAGDMHVIGLKLLLSDDDTAWQKMIAARKKPWRQAALIGFGTIWRFVTGRLSLAEAEMRVQTRLKIRGRTIICPFAEAGMDIDKPHQLAIVEEYLGKRSG